MPDPFDPAVGDEPIDHLPPPAGRALPMALAAYVLSIVLASIAFYTVREGDQDFGDLGGAEVFAVNLPSLLTLGAAAFAIAAPGHDALRALRLRGSRLGDLGGGFVVGVLTQLALVPLYVPILWFVDGDVGEEADELTSQFGDGELWLLVVLVAVLAPVAEELFFRGLVQGSLERSLPAPYAVGIAAVIFALIHFQWLQLPGLLLFGAVSGVLLVRTGRLAPSIGAHVGFNSAGVVGLLIDRLG